MPRYSFTFVKEIVVEADNPIEAEQQAFEDLGFYDVSDFNIESVEEVDG